MIMIMMMNVINHFEMHVYCGFSWWEFWKHFDKSQQYSRMTTYLTAVSIECDEGAAIHRTRELSDDWLGRPQKHLGQW